MAVSSTVVFGLGVQSWGGVRKWQRFSRLSRSVVGAATAPRIGARRTSENRILNMLCLVDGEGTNPGARFKGRKTECLYT